MENLIQHLLAIPKIPKKHLVVLDNFWFRLFFLSLIAWSATHDPVLGVALSVAFIFGLEGMLKAGENVENYEEGPQSMSYPGCFNITISDILESFENNQANLLNAMLFAKVPRNVELTDGYAPLIATFLLNKACSIFTWGSLGRGGARTFFQKINCFENHPNFPQKMNLLNENLITEIIDLIDNNDLNYWKKVEEKADIGLQVFRSYEHEQRYKMKAEFKNDVEVCFNFCTDILARPKWDEMCAEAKIFEKINENTRIQYTRSKAIFPVAARDNVNIFHTRVLADGRLLSLAHSVKYDKQPVVPGVVRADAVMIGAIYQKHPTKPGYTIITQINEMDPKGWIPKTVIKTITAIAVPSALRKLQSKIEAIPKNTNDSAIHLNTLLNEEINNPSFQDIMKKIKSSITLAQTDKNAPFPGRGYSEDDDVPTDKDRTWREGIILLEKIVNSTFEKNPDKLPLKGKCKTIPWPSDFFPAIKDGINSISNDKVGQRSATSRYAAAFNISEKVLEDEVSATAGIDRQSTFNRTCNDDSECKQYENLSVCAKRFDKELGRNQTIGHCIPFWFGLCHAWTPSSIMEPEPQCGVTFNDVEFGVMDIKALLIQSYDGTNFSTAFTARRCLDSSGENGAPKLDEFGRFQDLDCRDMTPHFFHLAMSNMVGIHGKSFIVDVTADVQVWNQPIAGFEILSNQSVTQKEALDAVFPGITMNSTGFTANATTFAKYQMRIDYVTEATSQRPIVSSGLVDQFIVSINLNYILSMDRKGEIVGSEWIGTSKANHPDFLWVPTSTPSDESIAAGGIKYSFVKQILEMSQNCSADNISDEGATALNSGLNLSGF
ncbi:hypothetical protein HK099_007500 [Clydaea vesicula]|uniref:START domain-containing protein n=1 Tax=Clydaea vesicula TaxID=447962 RepID=A0AAD5TWR8_9FUNG|nr:hypothetical protein HK099_007500 [Clydaea vesicula]